MQVAVLVSGQARVSNRDGDVVAVLQPGEFVGEFGFIEQGKYMEGTAVSRQQHERHSSMRTTA